MTRRSSHTEPSTSSSQDVGREFDVSPNLWKNLPEELLELAFAKLPFEGLVRLRRVCKRWNHLILSGDIPYLENPSAKCLPGHYGGGAFRTYNSIRQDWQEHSLAFLGSNLLTSGLRLICSAGGLLCFSTYVPSKLAICNPLTRNFRNLEMPQPAVGESDLPQLYCTEMIQVAMGAYAATGNYEILVAVASDPRIITKGENAGFLRGRLLGYDSTFKCWKQYADVPRDILFWLGDSVFCNRSFYCLAAVVLIPEDEALWDWMLVKYDLERDCWSIFPPVLGMNIWVNDARIVEHQDSLLLVLKTNSSISILKFDESNESSSGIWVGLKNIPPKIFRNFKKNICPCNLHGMWWCISKGDLLFIINPCRGPSGVRSMVRLIVLVHDFSKNRWDWIPVLEGDYDPHNYCAFQPSFACP